MLEFALNQSPNDTNIMQLLDMFPIKNHTLLPDVDYYLERVSQQYDPKIQNRKGFGVSTGGR